jgi:hypothetical protein
VDHEPGDGQEGIMDSKELRECQTGTAQDIGLVAQDMLELVERLLKGDKKMRQRYEYRLPLYRSVVEAHLTSAR